ncbi:MAG: thiamine pyrophosphate-dependent enzyme, partial [Pseudomonadota bacterium]
LPSDVLAGPAPDVAPNTADRAAPAPAPAMAARTGLSEDAAFEITTRLAQAERPFIVIGGGGWSSRAAHRLQAFAELLNVPVATAPRRQDFIDNRSAVYAGHVGTGAPAGLVSALRDSDALLVIGAVASELAAAGILPIDGRAEGPALLQITATLGDAATSAQPVIQALCANQEAVDQLFLASQDLVAEAPALADPPRRVDRLRELHNAQVTARQPEPGPGTVQLGEVIRTVADTAPDAIICSGTGNYIAWVQRHHPFTAYGTQLATTADAKGFGLPAAIAAALTTPERPIICYAGDGCFMATAGELATVRQYGLKLTVIVANNGMFGAVRMHQESQYPERIAGTTLVNPDFVALAGAYGGRAWRVSQTAAFSQCLAEALDHEGVSLIELQLDPNAMTPTASLQDVRGG